MSELTSTISDAPLPLFPLQVPLFPSASMPLQIFEQRYIDMLGACMKNQSAFGVVAIRQGEEIKGEQTPLIYATGVEVSVTDWNNLPNGLLGIMIRGDRRFAIKEQWVEDDGLLMARVQRYSEASLPSLDTDPSADELDDLLLLLQQFKQHPVVQRMGMAEPANRQELAWQLGQLLPVSKAEKMAVLESPDAGEALLRVREYVTDRET